MPDISIKKAVLINGISRYSTIFLSLVFTAILSRILTPEDYGIAAIVTVFTAFFSILADLGMGIGVIQNKTLTETDVNHIFTFSIYIALGLAAGFCAFGFPLAWFYRNKVYIPVAGVLALSLFFNTLNMIPNAMLLKEKRFLLLGIRLMAVTICTYGVTIALALSGFKYYALVIQSVLSGLFSFIWNMKSVRIRPVKKINFASIQKIRQYSAYQFGFNFINYFTRNLDKLIIGKVMGNVSLAQYDKAYRMMLYPVQNLTHVITPALHPILSEHQHNIEFIYQRYMRIVKFLSLAGVFITVVCFWCSEEIIVLVFGNQWHDAVPVFKWLSLSIWAQMVTASIGPIYQSIGNTKLMFFSGLIHISISVICIIIGISLGNLETFSVIIVCGFIIKFFIDYFFLIEKGLKIKIFYFLNQFIPDVIIFIVLFGCLLFITPIINILSLSLLSIFIYKLIVNIILYFICLLCTKQWRYIKYIIDLFKQ